MCHWMGSHFHDWIDYNGVAFSIAVARMGSYIFGFFAGYLARENRHFATPPPVSPRNDVKLAWTDQKQYLDKGIDTSVCYFSSRFYTILRGNQW